MENMTKVLHGFLLLQNLLEAPTEAKNISINTLQSNMFSKFPTKTPSEVLLQSPTLRNTVSLI